MFPGALALVVAVVAVSWAAILIRLCEAPALGIAFWRLLFASLPLVPLGGRGLSRASASTWGLALAAGTLLAVHFATWISSLAFTSVASSVMLVATQPVWVALLAPLFLGERPGVGGVAGMALALTGTALLAGGDLLLGGQALAGDALALAGAVSGAAYLMIGRRLREQVAFTSYLLMVNGAATLVLGLLAWLGGVRLGAYPPATWLWIALLAAGPHLIGHGLLNWSVRRLRSFTVNVAVLGEPLLAALYAALLFDEIPGAAFYGGALLIAAGIWLAMREETRRRSDELPAAAPL